MKAKDFSNLYLFCQAVECGGFAAASVKTQVSAPTLSRAVAALEQQLGEKLIYRNAKHFQLTRAGEQCFQRVAPLLAQLDQQWIWLSNNQTELSGEIRVSCPEPFADHFLQQLAIDFMAQHPQVSIRIDFSTDLTRFFVDQIDLAVVTQPPQVAELVQRQLFESPLVMAAAPSYLAQHGQPQCAADLLSHALLAGNNLPFWELKEQGKTVQIPYQPRYSVSSLRLNIEATVAGAGIGLIPKAAFEQYAASEQLVPVLPQVTCPTGKVYLVWADRTLIAARVQAFKEMIFERFGQGSTFLAALPRQRRSQKRQHKLAF